MSAKFQCQVIWESWTLGITLPHGGMVVWSLHIGPLWFHYWPLAKAGPPDF